MKTFQDFINLKETSTFDVGNSNLNSNDESAFTSAMQAFEVIMSKDSEVAVNFLNRMSEVFPEIKAILQQHGLDSFKGGDFKNRSSSGKGRRVISKGLGDVSTDDVKNKNVDVVAANSADSYNNPVG